MSASTQANVSQTAQPQSSPGKEQQPKAARRVKTPTVLQMEAVECGAASLSIVLQYFGKILPLEQLRLDCGVSRDGSKASNIIKAARKHGLIAKGFKKEPETLKSIQGPMIIHWNFNHFIVLEGFRNGKVYVNDPAMGPRIITEEEFDQSFTGVVLTFEKSPEFVPGGQKRSLVAALKRRLEGSESALLYAVLAGLVLVVPGLVVPTFTQIFIDEILLRKMNHWLGPLLFGLLFTGFIKVALKWLQHYYLLRFETKLALSTSSRFFWHVVRLPVEFFTQRFGGEIGSRVMINDKVAQLVSRELATTVLNVIMIVFYLFLMLQYSVVLSIIGVCIAMLNILYLRLMGRKRTDDNQRLLQERGKLYGTSMSGLQIIETLKSAGSESDFFSVWSGYQAKLMNSEQTFKVSSIFLNIIPTFLTTLNTTVILALGGLAVLNGEMTIGMLVAFQFLMAGFIDPVNSLVGMGGKLQEMEGDMNRLDDVLNYPIDRRLADGAEAERSEDAPAKLEGYVELRNVTFGYSRLEAPLIENFSLKLAPGQSVALVGGSGSGKSTISKLIAGLYEPWSGEILFDGKARHELPRALVNNSISVVDQDICVFEGTITDNLTLWDTTIPKTSVIQAAKDACVHEIISERTGAYDHVMKEGGRNFSGGQLQRMEIARALATNPTIIVMDEGTSALDPKTEETVTANIVRRGCTTIIVAHRLSTIRDCDEIIVLSRGRVIQRGTHEQMKDVDGPYKELISAH